LLLISATHYPDSSLQTVSAPRWSNAARRPGHVVTVGARARARVCRRGCNTRARPTDRVKCTAFDVERRRRYKFSNFSYPAHTRTTRRRRRHPIVIHCQHINIRRGVRIKCIYTYNIMYLYAVICDCPFPVIRTGRTDAATATVCMQHAALLYRVVIRCLVVSAYYSATPGRRDNGMTRRARQLDFSVRSRVCIVIYHRNGVKFSKNRPNYRTYAFSTKRIRS